MTNYPNLARANAMKFQSATKSFLQFAKSFNDWGPFLDGRCVSDGQIVQHGQIVGWWQRTTYANGVDMTLEFVQRHP